MSASITRQLASWTNGFFEYTEPLAAPEIFRRWSALLCISGALERHVWTKTGRGKPIYPNMYIGFVAEPGVGKSLIITEVREMWYAGGLHVGPSTTTKAGMIDFLEESKSGLTQDLAPTHTALFAASELGLLVPDHDLMWLNTLNDLYDCPEMVEERTRGGGSIKIANPYVTIVGGSQPKFLASLFPEEAYGMGFMSRMIMVYAGAAPKVGLFDARSKFDPKLRLALEKDLRVITETVGEMFWSKETAKAFGHWHDEEGMAPRPNHNRLQGYNERRMMHIVKLAMCFSFSRNDELTIELEDFESAKELLLLSEELMPEIFKAMERGDHGQVIADTYTFIYTQWLGNKKPILESHVIAYLSTKVPANMINFQLETMIRANLIRKEPAVVNGIARGEIPAYVPVPKGGTHEGTIY